MIAARQAGERSAEREYAEAGQDERLAALESRQEAPPAPPAPSGTALADQLTKLQGLRESGALTAEEFAAAKQKLLNG